MKNLSTNVKNDRDSLNPKELITFIEITIQTDGVPVSFYLTDGETQTWAGFNWVNTPFQLNGISSTGSGERSRPKLSLPNDSGQFTYYVSKRFIEGADVTRYLVHPDDLVYGITNDTLMYKYYLAQVTQLSGLSITAELRSPSDGNNFNLPSRRFIQPEFPMVRL